MSITTEDNVFCDPETALFSYKACFTLNGKAKIQNNKCWCSHILMQFMKLQRAMSRCKIMAHHVFKETSNSYWYVWLILTQFFRELLEEEKCAFTSHRTMTTTRQTA